MDDLKTILDRIRKPLSFAARDDFAHIKSLAAMEAFIQSQVEDLKRIVKDHHEIAEIEALFAGFDALSLEKKKDRIIRAVAVIDAFGQSAKQPDGRNTSVAIPPHPSKEDSTSNRAGRPSPSKGAGGGRSLFKTCPGT